MPFPHSISGLTEREAIADVIYRAVLSVDKNDADLLHSCWVSDGDCSAGMGGHQIKGIDEIDKAFLVRVGPMDTTHFITNVRADIKPDGKTASVTASALAQHYRPGEGPDPSTAHLLTGGIYELDMVKEGADVNSWKIKRWNLDIIWRDGDRAVMEG